jgi:hypothetical protein
MAVFLSARVTAAATGLIFHEIRYWGLYDNLYKNVGHPPRTPKGASMTRRLLLYYIVHSDMCAWTIKRTHHCVAVATAVTRTRHIVTSYVRTLPSLFGLQVGWTSCKLGNPSRRWHSLRGSCCKCALCIWVSARRLGLRRDSNLSLPLKRPSGVSVRLVWTWITGSMSLSLVGASGMLTLPVCRRRLPAARSIPPPPPPVTIPLCHGVIRWRIDLISARPVPPRNYKIRSDLWCTKYVLG